MWLNIFLGINKRDGQVKVVERSEKEKKFFWARFDVSIQLLKRISCFGTNRSLQLKWFLVTLQTQGDALVFHSLATIFFYIKTNFHGKVFFSFAQFDWLVNSFISDVVCVCVCVSWLLWYGLLVYLFLVFFFLHIFRAFNTK